MIFVIRLIFLAIARVSENGAMIKHNIFVIPTTIFGLIEQLEVLL